MYSRLWCGVDSLGTHWTWFKTASARDPSSPLRSSDMSAPLPGLIPLYLPPPASSGGDPAYPGVLWVCAVLHGQQGG